MDKAGGDHESQDMQTIFKKCFYFFSIRINA